MYRDDVCAVCGESLPPDHFYCRQHSLDVDERLHEIAKRLPDVRARVADLRNLARGIAEETWDYVAESHPDNPFWPPDVDLSLRVDTEQVDIDVDEEEPGCIRVKLNLGFSDVLALLEEGLVQAGTPDFLAACSQASGANATH